MSERTQISEEGIQLPPFLFEKVMTIIAARESDRKFLETVTDIISSRETKYRVDLEAVKDEVRAFYTVRPGCDFAITSGGRLVPVASQKEEA